MPPRRDAAEADAALVRAIGLPSAVLLVIGSVVGSGIFLTTGLMAETLPSTTLLLGAWALGGLFALAGGLTYAEMGAMFPRSGGVYVFLREAYGSLPAFLYGWAALLVVVSGGIAAVAVGFAEYLSYFVPALSPARVVAQVPLGPVVWRVSAGQLVGAASIALLGAVNYVGVRSGNFVNAALTSAKVAALAALPVMAIVVRRVDPVFTPVVPPGVERPLAAFGVAMIAVLWTYEAWYFVTYAAGEVKDPRRNLPRALLYGTLALTGIYLSVNVAYFYALRLDELTGVTRIAEEAARALVGRAGADFVAVTVVVSTFGCNAAAILAGSRLLFAMSADGVFFRAAGAVHPRYRTPHVAIVGLSVWSAILALSGSYEQLFTYVMFASVLFSAAGGVALFRLRRLRPDHPRPYRAWGYPVVPALFVLGSIAFVWNTLVERPVESLAGIGLLALGLPAYAYWRAQAAREAAG
ncbi:MAG TPA: amino acid permease [Vicinamibacterales bacterium]|nr:amino acid permease [Vicinamibacterales bacterium]